MSHNIGDVLIGDPTLDAPIYKNTGTVTIPSTGIVTTGDMHNLSTNDEIQISGTTSYEDVFKITVTGPKTLASVGSSTGTETGIWTLVNNKDSSASNPIKLDISSPTLKTMFGGLDMRKSKTYTVITEADGTDSASEQAITMNANHLLSEGDVLTYNSDTAAMDGTYIVDVKDPDEIDLPTTAATTGTSKTNPVTINQWEALVAERGSNARIGELRSGFNSWDKGNIQNNSIRYDTDSNITSFMSTSEAGITVSASSIASQSGDFFQANTTYSYKITFIYDGYQEGPLSNPAWNFEDTVTRNKIGINIKISEYSKRLSHVCIYRRDTVSDFYKLVEQVPTASGWAYNGSSYSKQVEDDGTVGASYSARTGMSEVLDTIRLKYGISTEIDGYLFAGDCAHSRIENASNLIFRSRPGMFSIFDYANDFLTLKSKPTAMVNFN